MPKISSDASEALVLEGLLAATEPPSEKGWELPDPRSLPGPRSASKKNLLSVAVFLAFS
jgi:hypothetical protein